MLLYAIRLAHCRPGFDPRTRHVILGVKTWPSKLETVSPVWHGSSGPNSRQEPDDGEKI